MHLNVENLEKVELHCHVDGLVNPDLLGSMARRGEHHPISLDRLEKMCPVSSLEGWLEEYEPFIDPYVSNKGEFILRLLEQHILNLKQERVVYTEIMLSSFIGQYPDLDRQLELFGEFRKMAKHLESGQIQVEFLIAIGRTKNREAFDKRAERVLAAAAHGYIVGVALAGDEQEATVKAYTDWFKEFKRKGLKIEIHAGEWCGPESVWDAIEYGDLDRIGHGLAVFNDPSLLSYIKDHDLHIEMCPTSNIILAGVESIHSHPIKTAIEEGLNFSVNTDDPGPLCISMNSEFDLLASTFGLKEEDFEVMKRNSLRSRFAEDLRVEQLKTV